jgi:hypothetical protein
MGNIDKEGGVSTVQVFHLHEFVSSWTIFAFVFKGARPHLSQPNHGYVQRVFFGLKIPLQIPAVFPLVALYLVSKQTSKQTTIQGPAGRSKKAFMKSVQTAIMPCARFRTAPFQYTAVLLGVQLIQFQNLSIKNVEGTGVLNRLQ